MRPLISPPLNCSFRLVFDAIAAQPSGRTPQLETTGGTPFTAEAKMTRDGRQYIALPHANRIYESDWGHTVNGMGKDGQRIGHYSVPYRSLGRSAPDRLMAPEGNGKWGYVHPG